MKDPSKIGLQSRRDFPRTLSSALPRCSSNSLKPAFQDARMALATSPAKVTLRIGIVDVSCKRTISFPVYNGNFSGRLIRLREGVCEEDESPANTYNEIREPT